MKMGLHKEFAEVRDLISNARERVFRTVNRELIDLYWNVGKYLSEQIAKHGWGKGVVKELAAFFAREEPGVKGFSAQNLWRMKQFFDQYSQNEKLSPLVRELTWTNNMVILGRTKDEIEREFYLRLSVKEKLSKRALISFCVPIKMMV